MAAELKPYPAYKDSGVEWLGAVPAHWAIERGKWLFRKMDRPVREADEVVTCFRDGVVTLRKNRRVRGFTESLQEIGYQGIRRGDLVVHGMDAFAGAIGVADSDGKGTPVYSVCRPGPTARAEYYAHTLREMARSQWIQALAKGVRERSTDFRFENFGSQRVPHPPLPEQAVIVRFLKHADRHIQHYIRAKEMLVALLEEQKQAFIRRAITGEVDIRTGKPYSAYKSPATEWLGEVPERWNVVRLKFVATEIVDCLHATPNYSEDGEFPAIRTADVSPGEVHVSSALRVDAVEYVRWTERLEPKCGDILYSREGERFGIAACVPDGVRLCISQRMMMFRIRAEHNSTFVMWALNSEPVLVQARQYIMGATAPHVNVSTIRNYRLALPERDEQDRLVDSIENTTKRHDTAIAAAKQSIVSLAEYRTRLVADVVTGRVDVRAVAPGLPETDSLAAQTDDDHAVTAAARVDGQRFMGARELMAGGR